MNSEEVRSLLIIGITLVVMGGILGMAKLANWFSDCPHPLREWRGRLEKCFKCQAELDSPRAVHFLDRFKQRRLAIALVCVAVVIAGILVAWVAAGRPYCGTHVREGDIAYWGCSTDPSPYGRR